MSTRTQSQEVSDELFRLLVSSVSDYAIIMLGPTGEILTWNKGAEKIKGYKASEIIGENFSKFYTDADNNAGIPQFELQQSQKNGRYEDLGWRVRKDNTQFFANVSITPLFNKDNQLRGFAKITRDMTDRKHSDDALAKLKEEEEIFRPLVSSVLDYAIIVLDPEGLIITWNEGAHRITGYGADEITGQSFTRLYTIDAITAGKPSQELDDARNHGRFDEMDWRVRKDGSQFFAHVTTTPLKDHKGLLRGFAEVFRDVTDRKEYEDTQVQSRQELQMLNVELAMARDQAQAASKYKSEFVANMSHEIRTPLNGIIGMCNVLLTTRMTDAQSLYADAIKTAGNSLLTIINDILDFSKIEAGRIDLESNDFNPVKVVETACEILASTARQKNLTLMSYIDPAIPQHLRGDQERLRQILINFISNAIKFTESGEIVVNAVVQTKSGDSVNVRFSVTDSGIGLTEEQQARLFQPFVQADGTINRRFGGTGLGLSISKQLVELMDGTIGIDSAKDSGSTFWFVVPFEVCASAVTLSSQADLFGLRVLNVDDEPNSREIVHQYVSSWGLRSETAATVQAGMELLRKGLEQNDPFRIVILDLAMPGLNGIDMAREIFYDPALRNIHLILLTAFDSPGLGVQAIKLGFKGYVTKPVRQSQLLDCLMTVVSGGQSLSKLASPTIAKDPSEPKIRRKELILVAEDNILNQQVAQLYLDTMGYSCHIASNGQAAIDANNTIDYALILMDSQMPDIDGLLATQLIRQAEMKNGKHIPIIAMTASALKGDREKCIAAGMDDYISKPIDIGPLEKMIEKWLPQPVLAAPAAKPAEIPIEVLIEKKNLPIDLDDINERYGTHGHRLLSLFMAEVPIQFARLKQAVTDQNQKELLDGAHGLKGLCVTLTAFTMHDLCAEIENFANEKNWSKTEFCLSRLELEFERVQTFLHPEPAVP